MTTPIVQEIFNAFNEAEVIVEDIEAFAAGQPESYSKTVDGMTYSGTVVQLPNGPEGTNYQVITGGWFSILGIAVSDAAKFASGAQVSIAEKVGNTWFGTTMSAVPVPPTESTPT